MELKYEKPRISENEKLFIKKQDVFKSSLLIVELLSPRKIWEITRFAQAENIFHSPLSFALKSFFKEKKILCLPLFWLKFSWKSSSERTNTHSEESSRDVKWVSCSGIKGQLNSILPSFFHIMLFSLDLCKFSTFFSSWRILKRRKNMKNYLVFLIWV